MPSRNLGSDSNFLCQIEKEGKRALSQRVYVSVCTFVYMKLCVCVCARPYGCLCSCQGAR